MPRQRRHGREDPKALSWSGALGETWTASRIGSDRIGIRHRSPVGNAPAAPGTANTAPALAGAAFARRGGLIDAVVGFGTTIVSPPW